MPLTVSEVHPYLLHYTSVAGLLGILGSQSLHATHSAFLNDSMEISLFFETRLRNILESEIRAALAADPELLLQFAKTPEEVDAKVRAEAAIIAAGMRAASNRLFTPYVVCLSAPANERIRYDGLLSQWRGYGKDGGYALEFDTMRLEELLAIESASFQYQQLQLGDVHYYQDDNDDDSAQPEIQEAEEALRSAIAGFIKNRASTELESMCEPVTTLSCLYKHWGFHEETEVRIVAIPPTDELVGESRATGELRPIRQRSAFVRAGTPVPYLDLFAQLTNDGVHLPIRRVIVGPHPQSQLRRLAVEKVLRTREISAEVVVSRIPYIGG